MDLNNNGQPEGPHHTLVQHWISFGDVLVLVVSVATTIGGLAFTYGGISRDVQQLREAVNEMEARDMTPGAAQAIASMTAQDRAQDDQLRVLREDAAEFRREVRASLERIESKLDSHDKR